MTNQTDPAFAEWVILELLGHRRLAGHLTEATIAGAPFLRIDVPSDPPATQYYAPGSVYAITPTTEEIARQAARHGRPTPVQRWELEPAKPPVYRHVDADPYDRGEPDLDDDGNPF